MAPRGIWRFGTLVAGLLLAASFATAQDQEVKKEPIKGSNPASGAQMYKQYCAVCHGTSGKGDGPAAEDLKTKPADLTQLAKKNGGKFPQDHVAEVLRNGVKAPAHGTAEMPTWGPLFSSVSSKDEAIVNMRIANVTAYVKSLQEK